MFTLINLVCIELSKFEAQNNLETSVKYISMHRFKQLGLVVSLSMGVLAAHAQTPAAAPPPAWKQGMSDAMATSTLAPLAGKLTATKAADVPIEKRSAQFKCVVAFVNHDSNFEHEELGELKGQITLQPAGDEGFGYDPIFTPINFEQTLAQLGAGVKDRISHRGQALRAMAPILNQHL